MRLGITVDMSGAHPKLDIERVKEAERLGFSQAWTGKPMAPTLSRPLPGCWPIQRSCTSAPGSCKSQLVPLPWRQ